MGRAAKVEPQGSKLRYCMAKLAEQRMQLAAPGSLFMTLPEPQVKWFPCPSEQQSPDKLFSPSSSTLRLFFLFRQTNKKDFSKKKLCLSWHLGVRQKATWKRWRCPVLCRDSEAQAHLEGGQVPYLLSHFANLSLVFCFFCFFIERVLFVCLVGWLILAF